MEQKVLRKLEKEIEDAVAEVNVGMDLKKLPLTCPTTKSTI